MKKYFVIIASEAFPSKSNTPYVINGWKVPAGEASSSAQSISSCRR
jgi:hypothetical protein